MIARLKAAGPALFAVLAAVTLIGVSSTGTHLVRLPDRGTGWTRLRSSGDTLVAAGFFFAPGGGVRPRRRAAARVALRRADHGRGAGRHGTICPGSTLL
ncbi:MAG: hypothetical protein M5R36_12660 [Deltaproteobacteria bacterium]|nr:hypothetical protein [Deltaproteobacteria bacterium]